MLLLSTITSQRIPQSFFPLRQDSNQPYSNTSLLPLSHLPSPPSYDHPNQRGQTPYQPGQQIPYQPIPYTPHQIAAYNPVQNLNQIGRVDPVQSYDQTNPYGNDNPALNLGPLNQARVPIVNDPTLVQIAQYSNPQIPDILRNSLLSNVPHVDNQLNYNLISPNGQSPTLTQNPERPSGYGPNALPEYANRLPQGVLNGNLPPEVNFQPYNPYVGLFNQSGQQQSGYPLQLPHFSISNPNNAQNLSYPSSGQVGNPTSPNPGWFQANPNHPSQHNPFQNPHNSGPINLHTLPNANTAPPLKVPQLPQFSQYTPPQLPALPSPPIPTPPPNLFVPPTLPPDAVNPYLVGSAGIVGLSPTGNPFSVPFNIGELLFPYSCEGPILLNFLALYLNSM